MFEARNGFSFHRGPGGGLDVVVRYAKTQKGEVFESVSLDKKEFEKLLDYLGIEQLEPVYDTPEPPFVAPEEVTPIPVVEHHGHMERDTDDPDDDTPDLRLFPDADGDGVSDRED